MHEGDHPFGECGTARNVRHSAGEFGQFLMGVAVRLDQSVTEAGEHPLLEPVDRRNGQRPAVAILSQ